MARMVYYAFSAYANHTFRTPAHELDTFLRMAHAKLIKWNLLFLWLTHFLLHLFNLFSFSLELGNVLYFNLSSCRGHCLIVQMRSINKCLEGTAKSRLWLRRFILMVQATRVFIYLLIGLFDLLSQYRVWLCGRLNSWRLIVRWRVIPLI